MFVVTSVLSLDSKSGNENKGQCSSCPWKNKAILDLAGKNTEFNDWIVFKYKMKRL